MTADAAPLPADQPAPAAPARRPPDLSPAECAARLAELFPALFAVIPNTPPRPIKLRIQADIQQRAPELFTRRVLSHFLHRHTTTTAYLRALVASPHRYDLDGAPAGEVLDEHRQAAQLELDRRRAIVDERRAAERQARQAAARGAGRDADPAAARPRPAAAGDAHAAPAADQRDGRPRPPRRPPPTQRPPRRESQAPTSAGDRAPAAPPRPKAHARVPTQTTPRTPDPVDAVQGPAAEVVPAPVTAPVPAAPSIDDPARRERALLLRAFEASPLSRANFCALKRIEPAALDALLEQARREAPPAPPPARRPDAPRRPPPPARRHSR